MADEIAKTTSTDATKADVEAGADQAEVPATPMSLVLAGTENFTAGELQIGLALRMKSSGVESTLMIPNVIQVSKGGVGGEVYITRPIRLEGKNLRKFLVKKGFLTLKDPAEAAKLKKGDATAKTDGEVTEPVGKFLQIAEISLEAFYFNKNGPWLMQFNLNTEIEEDGKRVGIIGTMTDDKDLGELFDILGASVRVFKCNDKDQYKVLQRYAARLSAK
jgi:hypothetical protein